MVGALGLACAALAAMPPPVPPTTPTGTEFPEAAVAAPGWLLLPITIATTTAPRPTRAAIAPTTTGLGPPFGVTFAIFLEASGRIWVVSFIRTNGDQGRSEEHTSELQS